MAQHFTYYGIEVIIQVDHSKIGTGYPRAFIKDKESYHNVDFVLGAVFHMTKEAWDSWFDSELKELSSKREIISVLADAGLNAETFLEELRKIGQDS